MTKNTNTSKATRAVYTILRQISTLVPREFASFAVVEDAAHHDSKRAGVCTGQLVQGDILVADRAYLGISGVGPLETTGTSIGHKRREVIAGVVVGMVVAYGVWDLRLHFSYRRPCFATNCRNAIPRFGGSPPLTAALPL